MCQVVRGRPLKLVDEFLSAVHSRVLKEMVLKEQLPSSTINSASAVSPNQAKSRMFTHNNAACRDYCQCI